MAKRRDNMLEAFKASSVSDSEASELPVEGGGGGPFGAPPSGPTPTRSSSSSGTGMTLPVGPGAFLVLQLALLVLAFLAGQASDGFGTVQAKGPLDGEPLSSIENGGSGVDLNNGGPGVGDGSALTSGQAQSSTEGVFSVPQGSRDRGARRPGAGADLSPKSGAQSGTVGAASGVLSSADQAFADPANRFTVNVFTADATDFGREMASVNHANLAGQGFAAVSPSERGGKVLLYVGAFANFAEADKARGRVSNAPGPDGRQTPYSGAYVVNIPR